MGAPRFKVPAVDWSPVGVENLELNALDVVRSKDNRSVIAGPGAGKTELLAQRAAFLLQTGASPNPQRILAISFKRDAASNLAQRVRKRCHPAHAARLDSMTFDAFAKSIVDRFGQALPEIWRPRSDYQFFQPSDRLYRNFLDNGDDIPRHIGHANQVAAIRPRVFEKTHLLGAPLPVDGIAPDTVPMWAANRFWQSALRSSKGSFLSFPMLGRLAELVLRVNPMAQRALALTYSHLFLDEFQDTTHIQYDLVKTIFLMSEAVVTAVGDNKQQIMRWAMAMDAPFEQFEHDFSATRTPLFNNYRSSPELVRIQHTLAQALDAKAIMPVSKVVGAVDGDACAVWDFSSPTAEAETLAQFIAAEMKLHNLGPRDFVLLVRQKAQDYVPLLAGALGRHGIDLRNEAAEIGPVKLQELLTEELSQLVVDFIRLSASDSPAKAWASVTDALMRIRGLAPDDEQGIARLERHAASFVEQLKASFGSPVESLSDAVKLVETIIEFVERDSLVATYPAYSQGDWLAKVAEATATHLYASANDATSWMDALEKYEGSAALPLMTIHKSKGLEYHTVIFVGLDDGAWWSFKRDQVEATAGFFVAFTRAKQRVVFTYCPTRGGRADIKTLYQLLISAHVPVMKVA
ncbi:ATP-dependent helicase [Paraburkholderia azotifigens]|uniref:ATP-dependent helicase n=1 Tax=Paraburkholderia azotifigens TaxID=2057004 RepID=UPI0031800157